MKERPKPFMLSNDDERYYLGSELGHYLGLYRGALYKKYPQLWRRAATISERKELSNLGLFTSLGSTITLLKGSEVDRLLTLHNDKTIIGKNLATKFLADLQIDNGKKKSRRVSKSRENNHKISSSLRDHGTNGKDNIGGNLSSQFSSQFITTFSNKKNSTNSNSLNMGGSGGLNSGCGWINPVQPGAESLPSATSINQAAISDRRAKSYGVGVDQCSKLLTLENAEQKIQLVPIRLDLDIDGEKLRDSFTWNRNEKIVTPELFAETICDDIDLSPTLFIPAIATSIRQQVEATTAAAVTAATTVKERNEQDQRVVIILNIQVGNVCLQDRFEWDLANPLNSPEQYATVMAAELGLSGEFVTAISYSIRAKLAWHQRTLAFVEAPPALTGKNIIRDEPWTPTLETLTDVEMEKKIRDYDRSTRRMRRLAQTTTQAF
ncbi:hypothetical protein SNEBB_006767 [Seison nebaliae]|nr:hypothetical protein SNEBB_006767 [Seison nebaliae]